MSLDALMVIYPPNEPSMRLSLLWDICRLRGMDYSSQYNVASDDYSVWITDKDGWIHKRRFKELNWRQLYKIVDELSGSTELAHLY